MALTQKVQKANWVMWHIILKVFLKIGYVNQFFFHFLTLTVVYKKTKIFSWFKKNWCRLVFVFSSKVFNIIYVKYNLCTPMYHIPMIYVNIICVCVYIFINKMNVTTYIIHFTYAYFNGTQSFNYIDSGK